MPWVTIIMLGLELGNIGIACATNFYCTIFLPTFSYLGCFRGHDRVFIVTCTYFALVLPITYIGGHLHFRSVASNIKRGVMAIFGIISCVSLPVLALVNEVNGVHLLPF